MLEDLGRLSTTIPILMIIVLCKNVPTKVFSTFCFAHLWLEASATSAPSAVISDYSQSWAVTLCSCHTVNWASSYSMIHDLGLMSPPSHATHPDPLLTDWHLSHRPTVCSSVYLSIFQTDRQTEIVWSTRLSIGPLVGSFSPLHFSCSNFSHSNSRCTLFSITLNISISVIVPAGSVHSTV